MRITVEAEDDGMAPSEGAIQRQAAHVLGCDPEEVRFRPIPGTVGESWGHTFEDFEVWTIS